MARVVKVCALGDGCRSFRMWSARGRAVVVVQSFLHACSTKEEGFSEGKERFVAFRGCLSWSDGVARCCLG